MDYKNLYELVERGAERFNNKSAFVMKKENKWQTFNWIEVKELVKLIAKSLIKLGVNKSNTVCILSNTRVEWILIDLAIVSIGGVTVPIYQSNTPSQCEYIINDSEAKIVFVEDKNQLEKVLEIKPHTPHLTKIINISTDDSENNYILSFKKLIESGEDIDDDIFIKRNKDIQLTDIATIIYTSGTTGIPKGAVITHENMFAQIIGATNVLPSLEGMSTLCFLPLAHVFARACQYIFIYSGTTQWFAESLEKVPENLKEAKPHLFIAVPRIFEKSYNKIISTIQGKGKLTINLFNWAVNIGKTVTKNIKDKDKIGISLKLKYKIANTLVFNKIKKVFGGKLVFVVSGGAPLSTTISEFFHSIGILILEGYGLSETTSATHVNQFNNFKLGTVGLPIDGIKTKLAEDGEVLVRGKSIMLGYYKNEKLTSEMIDQMGWFHTGDIGEIDSEGFLKIVDRKKDIIVTSGGKKISPQYIESCIKNSKYINEVMVYGDRRNFLSALIVINFETVSEWAKGKNIIFKNIKDLSRKNEVFQLIEKEIEKINSNLAHFETIKKFTLLEKEFTLEGGEMTPTQKLKRTNIIKNYQKLLDQFYEDRFN